MNIGNYNIYFKKSGGAIVPLIVIGFMIFYLVESGHIFFELSLLLVRMLYYVTPFFLLIILKEDLVIEKRVAGTDQSIKAIRLSIETKKDVLFIVFTLVCLLLLNIIGYILSIFLYLVFLLYILGVRNAKVLTLVPLCLVVFLYLFFQKWLLVPLPTGIFGY